MLLGPTMDPRIASELSLRVPHLGLRMREHGHRALLLAQRLEALGAKVGAGERSRHRADVAGYRTLAGAMFPHAVCLLAAAA